LAVYIIVSMMHGHTDAKKGMDISI